MSEAGEDYRTKNKRREELSDQLKQISIKIDKESMELRKHNNVNSAISTDKRRDSYSSGIHTATGKAKAEEVNRSQALQAEP